MNNLPTNGAEAPTTFAGRFRSEELHAYALALKVQAMAFYLPPREPFLTNLCVEALLADWPLAPDAPDVAAGLHLLRTTLCEKNAVQALLPALRAEYTALFIGLERVAAPPWESVYLSRDHLLFDEQTLQVRDAYAAFGLQIPHIDREPDDHIGFELLFLSHLMQQAAHALESDNYAEAERCLVAAHDFLHAHPLQWVKLFVERIERHAHTDYYRGMALLLTGVLTALATMTRPGLRVDPTPQV
jgi:TorA maturation chaperone TorD